MFRSVSRSTAWGLNWCFVKPGSLASCIDIGLVVSLIRMRSGTLRMTKHPNQAEHQAQRAPPLNRVSPGGSSPAFLSHEFSQANSRLAEGLPSKGFEREINGIQGEGKVSC
jgi:hypothetical protein